MNILEYYFKLFAGNVHPSPSSVFYTHAHLFSLRPYDFNFFSCNFMDISVTFVFNIHARVYSCVRANMVGESVDR